MKFAVIAAGEGSRLAAEGVALPKPLVRVGGEPLVDRLLRVFSENGAEEMVVICNDLRKDVADHLRTVQREGQNGRQVPLRLVVKTTPSSMHSLYEMAEWLDGEPFCVTTVDTIFSEDEFAAYVTAFSEAVSRGECDGLMGVTGYVDDEKPLYVDTDSDLSITAFSDSRGTARYISAGIYGLTPPALRILRNCVERGESRMRNFQRALVAEGMRLKAFPFGTVFDIDHATDIAKAEAFINDRRNAAQFQ